MSYNDGGNPNAITARTKEPCFEGAVNNPNGTLKLKYPIDTSSVEVEREAKLYSPGFI